MKLSIKIWQQKWKCFKSMEVQVWTVILILNARLTLIATRSVAVAVVVPVAVVPVGMVLVEMAPVEMVLTS